MSAGRLPNVIRHHPEARKDDYAQRPKCPRGFHSEPDPDPKPHPLHLGRIIFVRNGYHAVVCEHEPHTDNCWLCAPLWGVRAVLDGPVSQ